MAPKLDPTIWGNLTLSTVAITGSSVSGPLNAVVMGGDGTADDTAQDEDAFGAPGIVFRPRPPGKTAGNDGQQYEVGAEAIAARMGDRMTPFTWRDLRFNKVFPAPKPGTVALVGYGGGFLSFDDTGAQETLATLYVPYSNGTKAHAIIVDPENESVKVVHADGMALLLENDRAILKNKPGNAYVEVGADGIILNGNTKLVGGLDVGGSGAQPFINATAFGLWWAAFQAAVSGTGTAPLTGASLGALMLTATGTLPTTSTTLAKGL